MKKNAVSLADELLAIPPIRMRFSEWLGEVSPEIREDVLRIRELVTARKLRQPAVAIHKKLRERYGCPISRCTFARWLKGECDE